MGPYGAPARPVMQPCRCALCGTDARGDNLTDFLQSIDCPCCGSYEVTAAARFAWNSLHASSKDTALSKLRKTTQVRPVAIGREDVLRAAGLK